MKKHIFFLIRYTVNLFLRDLFLTKVFLFTLSFYIKILNFGINTQKYRCIKDVIVLKLSSNIIKCQNLAFKIEHSLVNFRAFI